MLDRIKTFFIQPWALFALLVFQCLVYWMIAIYIGGEAVPVAYQRF
jgi:hypothetical protein